MEERKDRERKIRTGNEEGYAKKKKENGKKLKWRN